MTQGRDQRDPVQKLKELHDWMLNNKVSDLVPEKPVIKTTWAVPQSPKAAAEVEDFQNWVKEIQTPKFVL